MSDPQKTPGSFWADNLFGGRYSVRVSDYEGFDFSARCLIFPGQGAASPGMCKVELLGSNGSPPLAAFVERFRVADALAAGLSLPPVSSYITKAGNPSLEQLARVRNAALFTAQVALADTLAVRGIVATTLTAHSFGEYAAFAVAGIASFEDLFRIVVERDRLSPPAGSRGAMIAVGGNPEQVQAALGTDGFELSNVNSPKQCVISVKPEQLRPALAALKAARLAAVHLAQMPQPYHTPWMADVARGLAAFIRKRGIEFRPPRTPLLSSVTGEWIEANGFSAAAMPDLLAGQLIRPVLFPRQIARVAKRRVVHFVETGPGETCTQFVNDTLAGSIYKAQSATKLLARSTGRGREGAQAPRLRREDGGVFGILSKVVASVTGYSIDEISMNDKFQEDLGIDSIRKAEIVFRFMDAMKDPAEGGAPQLDLSAIKRIEDVIAQFAEADAGAGEATDIASARFERFVEEWRKAPLSSLMRLRTREEGERSEVTVIDLVRDRPESLAQVTARGTIVLVASREPESAWRGRAARELFDDRLVPWLRALRELGNRPDGERPDRLALVREDGGHPYVEGLDGFLKSWLREGVFQAYKVIGLDQAPADRESLARLACDEFLEPAWMEARYVGGERYTKDWRPAPAATLATVELCDEPAIFSLGGTRGIGQAILEAIARARPGARIRVAGRSAETDSVVVAAMSRLRELAPRAEYVRVDATHAAELAQTMREFGAADGGRIDLVLHGAGREVSRSFVNKEEGEIWEEFAGKVIPMTTILDVSRDLEIKRLLTYSSVAAEFGNLGQTTYALANQVMASLARASGLAATTLVLPPWENLGMTENPVILAGIKSRGIATISPERGSSLVLDEISQPPCAAVAFLDANDPRAIGADLGVARARQGLFAEPIRAGRKIAVPGLNRRDWPYLSQHIINGNSVFPGSAGMALLWYAARLYFGREIRLESFQVLNFLPVPEDKSECFVHVTIVAHDRIRLQLASRIPHFQVEATIDERAEVEDLPPFDARFSVDSERILENRWVTLGKPFRLADGLWSDGGTRFLQRTRDQALPRYTSSIVLDRLQQWIESALQTFGTEHVYRKQRFWVPSTVESVSVRFDRELGDLMSYRGLADETDDETARGRAFALNARGETVLELRGVCDVAVGPDDLPDRFRFEKMPG